MIISNKNKWIGISYEIFQLAPMSLEENQSNGLNCKKESQSIIVFDINGTLIKRYFKSDPSIKLVATLGYQRRNIKNHSVFYRSHLSELASFLHRENIRYMFWSTMYSENVQSTVESLAEFDLPSTWQCFARRIAA